MKLLDLQTGKYLEIGYDWGYYGEYIVKFKIPYKFHFFTKEAYTIEDMCDRYAFKIIPHTNPIINQIAEEVGAMIYGGRYVLFCNKEVVYTEKPPAKSGDIIKFLKQDFVSTIYYDGITFENMQTAIKKNLQNNIFDYAIFNENEDCYNGYLVLQTSVEPKDYDDYYLFGLYGKNNATVIGNIFEEFAKKEQGLENKFDELYNLIYGKK